MTSPLAAADLAVPGDWLDLLEENPPGPAADAAARDRFTDLVTATLPTATPETVTAATEALLAWRTHLQQHNVISHGVINVPLDEAGEPVDDPAPGHPRWACWHVLTAVIAVPPVSAELDLGAFVAGALGQHLDPQASYVESFATDLGCGTGLLLQPALDPAALQEAGAIATTNDAARFGLAAGLTCPPGGGLGLLVTGACLDPAETVPLAALVANIAARSRVPAAEDAMADAERVS